MAKSSLEWNHHTKNIVTCERCPRLRTYCEKVTQEKRRAFKNERYWGKPVPSFGDQNGRLIILGLAPAAHGANRTGRMFTGDNSGLWLYRALFKAGFANQAASLSANDGLRLTDAFITATIHCAPPQNKPKPIEVENCRSYLDWELESLKNAQVYLALGSIAYHAYLHAFRRVFQLPRTKFGHGLVQELPNGKHLLCSYHPSQQNTFTGRLTEPMFDMIFAKAKRLLQK